MSFAKIGGVGLRYDWKDGAGVPLVLLHEMGGTLESWDLVCEALGDRAVLRLDLRGFGLSEKPVGPVTMPDHVADVTGLMDYVGIGRVHVAGCAVGGGVAIAVAAALGARAAGLTAMAPATGIPVERRAAVLGLADMLARDGVRGFLEADTIPDAWPEDRFDRSSRGFALFLQTQLGTAPATLAATYRMLAGLDLDLSLAALNCPAHFVAGHHDRARTPERVAPLVDKVRDGRFTAIDSGHFMALQSPDMVAALLA